MSLIHLPHEVLRRMTMRFIPLTPFFHKALLIVIALMAAGALTATVVLANPLQENIGSAGYVDWQEMRVVATGTGAVPANANAAQARFMGTRASTIDARRNLLEVLKGVRIDSNTLMENYIVRSDTIVSQVQGFIQGTQVDQTWITDDGLYHSTISLRLTGDFGKNIMGLMGKSPAPRQIPVQEMSPETAQRITALEQQVAALAAQLAAIQSALTQQGTKIAGIESSVTGQQDALGTLQQQIASPARPQKPGVDVPAYTGVVVDARGTDFTPCLKPELYAEDGKLFPSPYINLETAANEGQVRYMDSIPAAQKLPRVGSLPLTIKALSTVDGNKGALKISNADAGILKGILSTQDNFLDNCRVVLVF